MLGHGKKSIDQARSRGTHSLETAEGLVRTRKEANLARGTHSLKTAEGWTYQNTERNRPSVGHSLPGEYKEEVRSGHVKNVRAQRGGIKRSASMEYG